MTYKSDIILKRALGDSRFQTAVKGEGQGDVAKYRTCASGTARRIFTGVYTSDLDTVHSDLFIECKKQAELLVLSERNVFQYGCIQGISLFYSESVLDVETGSLDDRIFFPIDLFRVHSYAVLFCHACGHGIWFSFLPSG